MHRHVSVKLELIKLMHNPWWQALSLQQILIDKVRDGSLWTIHWWYFFRTYSDLCLKIVWRSNWGSFSFFVPCTWDWRHIGIWFHCEFFGWSKPKKKRKYNSSPSYLTGGMSSLRSFQRARANRCKCMLYCWLFHSIINLNTVFVFLKNGRNIDNKLDCNFERHKAQVQ